MMNLKLYIIFLISPFFLIAQEDTSFEGELPPPLSKIEQLILDIESEIDIEKRFDFSRSNSKEKQLADLKRIHKKVKSDLEAAEDLSQRLIVEFDENEKILSELEEKLTLKLGNLGEMFGVVKQVSGQTRGEFKNSITNIDNPNRDLFLKNLAESKKLPDLADISGLWVELLKEIRNAETIKTFTTEVLSADGDNSELEVLRIGTFSITQDGNFLKHLIDTNQVEFLPSQPSGVNKRKLRRLQGSSEGVYEVDIDPTRGAILDKLIQKKTFFQRIADGGFVGYVIILLGLGGVALASERIYVLRNTLDSIREQENSTDIIQDNLLGSLLQTAKENVNESLDSLELILDEKIQSITPTIEIRVKAIKLIATVAPLLGLLGTVIGMIETFQAITLFGTGDPKLMAGGISQALVTTMLGLIVAAPLLFMHSYAENYSKSIISFLEEKASGIVANKTKQ
jgi:biopolymer transport protein ExbB